MVFDSRSVVVFDVSSMCALGKSLDFFTADTIDLRIAFDLSPPRWGGRATGRTPIHSDISNCNIIEVCGGDVPNAAEIADRHTPWDTNAALHECTDLTAGWSLLLHQHLDLDDLRLETQTLKQWLERQLSNTTAKWEKVLSKLYRCVRAVLKSRIVLRRGSVGSATFSHRRWRSRHLLPSRQQLTDDFRIAEKLRADVLLSGCFSGRGCDEAHSTTTTILQSKLEGVGSIDQRRDFLGCSHNLGTASGGYNQWLG